LQLTLHLYQEQESAQKCVEMAKTRSVLLDGRNLDVVFAVSRKDIDQQKQEKTKEQKDNRNLYLAREGSMKLLCM